jgi:hypothetical protein
VGVLDASRLAAWPDRRAGLEVERPQLVAGRAGVVAHFRCAPVSLVLRVDGAEPTRPWVDTRSIGARLGAAVDDAYLLWRPARPAWLVVGRARVPWSKLRQFEELDLPLGAVPVLVDRVAPDRRAGATLYGDLGALAWAAGGYEDVDALEPRARVGDPSAGGRFAGVAHLEWTPRGPMMGSRPPGRVPGALGPLPTPRRDPWWDAARASFGVGLLWRRPGGGGARLDAALSAQAKWRWLAALGEAVVSSDGAACAPGGRRCFGAHGELMATPTDRLALTVRYEWDGGAGARGEWAAWAGATWHVTRDRRNKLALVGWLRRDVDRGTGYDGTVVLLQAAL